MGRELGKLPGNLVELGRDLGELVIGEPSRRGAHELGGIVEADLGSIDLALTRQSDGLEDRARRVGTNALNLEIDLDGVGDGVVVVGRLERCEGIALLPTGSRDHVVEGEDDIGELDGGTVAPRGDVHGNHQIAVLAGREVTDSLATWAGGSSGASLSSIGGVFCLGRSRIHHALFSRSRFAQVSQQPAPKYYRATDRYSASLWVVLPVVGGALAVVLGTAYAFVAYLIVHVFESPAGLVIATPLFGAALAVAARPVCKLAKVRARRIRLPVALVIGVLGLYAHWHVYLNFAAELHVFAPPPSWAMSPGHLLRAMSQLADSEGATSWLWWSIEAATVVGMIAYLMRAADPEIPFCEQCGEWTELALTLALADGTESSVIEKLEQGDAAALGDLRPGTHSSTPYVQVRVLACPCGASRFVCVDRITTSYGKRGGVRYSPRAIGAASSLHFDLPDPDTTELHPIITNLVIDEAQQQQLVDARSRLADRSHAPGASA